MNADLVSSNPYAPPNETETSPSEQPETATEFRRGPAWYIVFTGLAGGFASIPFLGTQNAIAFAVVLIGHVLGGFIFRVRSQHWPHDPTVRNRQMIYSVLAISLPPTALFFIASPNGQGLAIIMIGAIVGVSVACGIFASGTRRFRGAENAG